MGGKQPSAPQAPAPAPTVQETSAQAIQAQIDALPKILEAQKQYGGQFSEEQLKSLQEYGPQFAETALQLQREYGPQFAEVERSLSPELAGAQKTLADFLAGTDQAEYESLKPGLLEDVRAGQSQRGLGAISPLGSIDESVQLQRLKQNLKDRRLNVALSTANRVPVGGVPTIQGQTGTTQLIQGPSSSDLFGYQNSLNQFNASIFGTQADIFGTQSTAATNRRSQNIGLWSDVAGAGMAMAGGAVAMCWVAAEVFGGWEIPDTKWARFFINVKAPDWFRELYAKFGERFAKFISDKPILKKIVKPLFQWFSHQAKRCLNG